MKVLSLEGRSRDEEVKEREGEWKWDSEKDRKYKGSPSFSRLSRLFIFCLARTFFDR